MIAFPTHDTCLLVDLLTVVMYWNEPLKYRYTADLFVDRSVSFQVSWRGDTTYTFHLAVALLALPCNDSLVG